MGTPFGVEVVIEGAAEHRGINVVSTSFCFVRGLMPRAAGFVGEIGVFEVMSRIEKCEIVFTAAFGIAECFVRFFDLWLLLNTREISGKNGQ